MDLGVRGDEEEEGPCRETRGRCAREIELERIGRRLSPDAADALALFRAAHDQLRVGFSGPYALDVTALDTVSRFLRIEVTPGVFRLVRIAAAEALAIHEERRKEREAEAED